MIVLGLNINHADTSACLVKDGKILSACEEERFVRKKHYSGFPWKSINFCLNNNKLSFKDVDYIALNFNPKSNLVAKVNFSLKNLLNKETFFKILNFRKKLIKQKELKEILKKNKKIKILNINHHLCHISSAYYCSNFDKAIAISIDGSGDFSTLASYYINNGNFKLINKVNYPHSLGIFYQAITQYLGFNNYGDEYKVMGLAGFGKPKFYNQIKKLIKYDNNKLKLDLNFFSHHNQPHPNNWKNDVPKFDKLYSVKMNELLHQERQKNDQISQDHMDIASSLQKVFEEIYFQMILDNCNQYPNIENLCLSGGCALNSLANGKLKKITKKNIFIQPNAGDAGGAMGAALFLANKLSKNKNKNKTKVYFDPFLGPSFSSKEVQTALNKYDLKNYQIDNESNFENYSMKVAKLISEKKIIGWFQGKMEWGPRALGSRSIIADPSIKNIKEILNKKIKYRETFRPFAPVVLEEFKDEYFDLEYPSPYMLNVVKTKEKYKKLIPGVVHVDGTARVQTVNENDNFKFYKLIKNFYGISKIPIIINTSFNENEPIVCTPEEAIDCFVRTKMDVLAIENFIVAR